MTQLQQLRSEMRRKPGLLVPEQAALLEWLTDAQVGAGDAYHSGYGAPRRLNGTVLKPLLARIAGSPLASWAPDVAPDLAARGGIVPGGPVRLTAEPARLLPVCASHDGAVWVEFCFLWPDGRQRRLDDVLYLRGTDEWSGRTHPSFVLADGEFSLVIEEPPESLLERFRDAGGLPLAPAERGQVLALLAANFPHLREDLGAHTRYHQVTPVITLDLRDDDWLQIRLFAHSGSERWRPGDAAREDLMVFEYAPQGRWVTHVPVRDGEGDAGAGAFERIVAETAPTEDAGPDRGAAVGDAAQLWLEEPDPQSVAPALEWLAATQAVPAAKRGPGGHEPTWPDRTVGWWLQASRRRMDEFIDAWERVPPGVGTFGTDRIRRLLSGELRVTPLLHIESSGVDWFSVSAEWEAEGLQLTDADLAKLRAATTRFVKLSSGWMRRDVAELHDETAAVLADLGIEAGRGAAALDALAARRRAAESLQALERFGADAATLDAVRQLRDAGRGVHRPAAGAAAFRSDRGAAPLSAARPRLPGVHVVARNRRDARRRHGAGQDRAGARVARCICTTQEPDGGPSLVVCPASVVHNWAREAERFAPGLRVLLLTRGETRHELRREIPAHDLIVTNYALLRRDLEAWRERRRSAPLILDEAQNIKNPDAAVTRAALALQARASPGAHRHAAGEPRPRSVEHHAVRQPRLPRQPRAVREPLSTASTRRRTPARCWPPSCARCCCAAPSRRWRTELPERIEERRDCELTKEQRQLYLAELRRSRALVEQLSGAPGGITQNKIHVLAALTRLRQICCHPALAGGKASLGSGKFDALFELLEPLLAEGHKVLVFSQFVECLKLLAARDATAAASPHHMLTGQTVKRQQVVDAFQSDPQAVRLPDLAEGRRHRPQSDRRQLRRALRPVVESGRRGAGDRPHAPHRPGPHRHRLPHADAAARSRRRSGSCSSAKPRSPATSSAKGASRAR